MWIYQNSNIHSWKHPARNNVLHGPAHALATWTVSNNPQRLRMSRTELFAYKDLPVRNRWISLDAREKGKGKKRREGTKIPEHAP
jgi:hypothetical protein